MQILREALLQKLNTTIILFRLIRNKVLCLTEYQLIIINIDQKYSKVQIPYNGTSVRSIQLSKDYVAILQRSGKLQIRRLDNIKSVVLLKDNIKICNSKYPNLKWWEEDLHLIYQKKYQSIKLSPNSCQRATYYLDNSKNTAENSKNNNSSNSASNVLVSHAIPFPIQKHQTLISIQHCEIFNLSQFNNLKTVFYILNSSINICINNIRVTKIQFFSQQQLSFSPQYMPSQPQYQIKQCLKLCYPFQQNEYNRQYLCILLQQKLSNNQRNKEGKNRQHKQKRTKLQVYNILTMNVIFQKQLVSLQQQKGSNPNNGNIQHGVDYEIKLSTDDLCEYLLVKYCNKKLPNVIKFQSLMKINKQYYYGVNSHGNTASNANKIQPQEQLQPFFIFDIQIGLKKNLQMFPSHSQEINSTMCNSIDTCYYQKNQIFIASIVVDSKFKDRIYSNVYNKSLGSSKRDEIQQIWDISEDVQQDEENVGKHSQIAIWKQIIQSKLNPNKYIDKLYKRLVKSNKYKYLQHEFNQQKNDKSQNPDSLNQQKQLYNLIKKQQEQNFLSLLKKHLLRLNFNNSNTNNSLNTNSKGNVLQQNQSLALTTIFNQLKSIMFFQYYPMVKDVMTICSEEDNRKIEKEILQKSSQDFGNTRSGMSTSGQHSPRSTNSNLSEYNDRKKVQIVKSKAKVGNSNKYNRQQRILKGISDDDQNVYQTMIHAQKKMNQRYSQSNEELDLQQNDNQAQENKRKLQIQEQQYLKCCHQCEAIQLQDYQNLKLASTILEHSTSPIQNSMQNIQNSLHRMQTLTINRLQKIQRKIKQQKSQQNMVERTIQEQFNLALDRIKINVAGEAERFRNRMFKGLSNNDEEKHDQINKRSVKTDKNDFQRILNTQQQSCLTDKAQTNEFDIKNHYLNKLTSTCSSYQSQLKLHKINYNQLLDYLYDIEFPQL